MTGKVGVRTRGAFPFHLSPDFATTFQERSQRDKIGWDSTGCFCHCLRRKVHIHGRACGEMAEWMTGRGQRDSGSRVSHRSSQDAFMQLWNQGWKVPVWSDSVNPQQCDHPPRTLHHLEQQPSQFPPCQSKHGHNSQGKPEASARQEDIKSCQYMGNANIQPDFCLCLLKAVQQK